MSDKKIAIIGTGQSGLGAFNACREQHFADVVVYERSDSLCGLWANRDETQRKACNASPRLLSTTTLNSSKDMNAYSDFTFPQHYPYYVHYTLIVIYVNAHTLVITFNMTPAGAANSIFEQQCRYFALLMADRCRLPSEKRMLRDIRRQKAWVIRHYSEYNKHSTHVRYIKYMDELAREMGVKPRLWKYAFTDPKLWWRLYAGPCVPYQYRLDGPNSWSDAREAILAVTQRIRAPFKTRVNI